MIFRSLGATDYTPRLVDVTLSKLVKQVPAVLLTGPRGSGKTTTASQFAASTIDLGDPNIAELVQADARNVIASYETPVLIDEWQLAPTVMSALKYVVDSRRSPGQFIVTGSTSTDQSSMAWPATGRLVRMPIWNLTVKELMEQSTTSSFVDALFDDSQSLTHDVQVRLSLKDYLDAAVAGGFPGLVDTSDQRTRSLWLNSFVSSLIARDVDPTIGEIDIRRLTRYLTAIATTMSTTVSEQALASSAEINRITAVAYRNILTKLYVIEELPAWSNNKFKQLSKTPKLHFVEPALAPALMHQDSSAIQKDPTNLGRLIESFVVAQLRPELSISITQPSAYHFRDARGDHEIDLLLEAADGGVVAIEIKASSNVSIRDAKHMIWLRDHLGEKFVRGVVLYTGTISAEIVPRISAMPISSIWST